MLVDRTTLNSQLINWFTKYCPDWLNRLTGEDWNKLLDSLPKDVYKAARSIEALTGIGNEDLINAIRTDLVIEWGEKVLNEK